MSPNPCLWRGSSDGCASAVADRLTRGLAGLGSPGATPPRRILGLNSARLYGLEGSAMRAVGRSGSPYKQGELADYASFMEPGSSIDTVLQGVGYPTPITPASLLPNDNFTKMKKQYAGCGGSLRSLRGASLCSIGNDHPFVPTCPLAERRAQRQSRMLPRTRQHRRSRREASLTERARC